MSLLKFFKKRKKGLPASEDWLNVQRTRNCANTDVDDYNCGGYCLNTFSWYNPYIDYCKEEGYTGMADWIQDMLWGWEHSIEEVYDTLIKIGRDQILQDFEDTVRLIHNPDDVREDEKLVVYKIGIVLTEDEYGDMYLEHTDFHFKQWEGTYWSDKLGGGELRMQYVPLEEMIEETWVNSWWNGNGYNSEPVLFAVKRG